MAPTQRQPATGFVPLCALRPSGTAARVDVSGKEEQKRLPTGVVPRRFRKGPEKVPAKEEQALLPAPLLLAVPCRLAVRRKRLPRRFCDTDAEVGRLADVAWLGMAGPPLLKRSRGSTEVVTGAAELGRES